MITVRTFALVPCIMTVPLYELGPYRVLADCSALARFVGPYHLLHCDCDPGPTVPYRSDFHSQGWGPAGPSAGSLAPGPSVGLPFVWTPGGWPSGCPGRPPDHPAVLRLPSGPTGFLVGPTRRVAGPRATRGRPLRGWPSGGQLARPLRGWPPSPGGRPVAGPGAVRRRLGCRPPVHGPTRRRLPSARGQRHEVARAVRFLVGPASRGRTIPFRFLGQKVLTVRTYRGRA